MEGSRPATGSATTLALAVGLCALVLTIADVCAHYAPSTWIQRDGRFYTNVNVTLVEEGSVDQGELAASWYRGDLGWNRELDASWSNIALGRNGEHLPKHPILLPLLSTPLFFAFGLIGTLIFNVLCFSLAGGAAFVVARRGSSDSAAAFCALALMFATGIRDHAYDYHIDVLILALFTSAMAALTQRRGMLAGLLLGLSVVCRPTMLLWLPSLALIVAARRDFRVLGRAMIGGTIPLVLFALSNWWLYGAPWWTGYNRVLIVTGGEPTIADHSDAFGVPLRTGLTALWEGPWGVRHRLTLVFGAAPGLLILARKRPAYVIAALVGVVLSVLVFAQYRWYGDRFLWPSAVLLLPALAATFDALARLLPRHPEWRPSIVAALGAAAALGARAAFGGPIDARIPGGELQDLLLHVAGGAALAFGLARAASRFVAPPIAVVAPVAFFLFPGIADRVLAGGHDLSFAVFVGLALGARHWLGALIFAAIGAWLAVSAPATVVSPDLLGGLREGAGRALVPLLLCAFLALPAMGRNVRLLAPLALLGITRLASLGHEGWPLFAIALLCLPLPLLAERVARSAVAAWAERSATQRVLLVSTIFTGLLAAGIVARLDPAPFHVASYQGVRRATVHLGDVPCDFLAWEHLSWECATFDRGVHAETGLATDAPLHVAGRDEGLFLITAQRGQARRVRWDGVMASDRLDLTYAVPDEIGGGGVLRARVDDTELAALELPLERDGRLFHRVLDTSAFRGRPVSLELTLSGSNAAVLLDATFAPAAPPGSERP